MAIVRDDMTGLYMDIRRLVTGRGATAESAKAEADRAEAALRAQMKRVPLLTKWAKRGLLSEAELRHVIGERK